ncbi:hypothetical protein VD0002_g4757 [Verticillium dahliae]|nr:hypothetical protein VdG2_07221 [Verticillium dahliae VDG2]KAF3355779.1 hypothetical protein VdG1_06828 [Verticillium dahliae VDG1]PNH63664.1 hypothetical protein VD0002_g4757 [Verticillium dahliae]PNH71218.1 hypothetical protein VD0001_g6312 [Verticillium dahliae]
MAVSYRSRRRSRRLMAIAAFLLLALTIFFILRSGSYVVRSSFDWSQHVHTHAVAPSSMHPLPVGQPKNLPRVQHDFARTSDIADEAHLAADALAEQVRKAFQKCWASYKKYAWQFDELVPVSAAGRNTFGGWAATLVDSLDTLWIMGLETEFDQAVAVVARLDWANTTETAANVFETTIRHLGGILSAYDLSNDARLLFKAVELGDMLYASFDTPNRLPPFWLDFELAKHGRLIAGTSDPSASPCSLSLEFTRLSQLTGDTKYFDAIERVKLFLGRTQHSSRLPGMWPALINFREETVDVYNEFTLGALADSLYEYLPKMYALLGGLDASYEKMYRDAMDVVESYLLIRPMVPDGADILFVGTAFVDEPGKVRRNPETQHLTCFVGGMFALGGKLFGIPEHVSIGKRLARGCAWGYSAFPTGIMPEIFGVVPCKSLEGCQWDEAKWRDNLRDDQPAPGLPKGFTHARDPRYILRPEAIESVFLLYRMTGDAEWRRLGQQMFVAIEKATKTEFAYSAIADVMVNGDTQKLDSMESFWTAETLKYFYLLFSPEDLLSLDDYVFNTEAHPFRRPGRPVESKPG